MEEAVRLYRLAISCFPGLGSDRGGRLVLSLFFKAILGVQRIFHFDSLSDVGFALLTGGRRILCRNTLGGLVRAAATRSVSKFIRLSQPTIARVRRIAVSIDEHAVPRFTRKFLIAKGFHTIRNKRMRIEKLFFSFGIRGRVLLDLVVTKGSAGLASVASQMLAPLRRRVRLSQQLRTVLDAGAAQNHRELLDLVDENHRHVIIVRTPRRTAYMERWKALPEKRFTSYDEPGRYKLAPLKRIHVAETTTRIRADKFSPPRDVRTIVVREEGRTGKDRWHALFVFGDHARKPLALIKEFRARQHHEQTYRVLLHDAFVDAAPSGYYKQSRNPDRPGFRKNALGLYAWVTGLAVNALNFFASTLPKRYRHAQPRTLRRWFLNMQADLYLGKGTLFIVMKPKWFRGWWAKKIKRLNAKNIRIPWMENRLAIYSLDAPPFPRAEPSTDPEPGPPGVGC